MGSISRTSLTSCGASGNLVQDHEAWESMSHTGLKTVNPWQGATSLQPLGGLWSGEKGDDGRLSVALLCDAPVSRRKGVT